MEQNNGRGVFYGVIGVATLIVAIVGATFAFFSASATNNNTVVGNTSEASNLGLSIKRVDNASGSLIPMKGSDLVKGLTGNGTNSCTDSNGNTVCHVYEITVTNGKSPVKIAGNISFSTKAQNIVYGILKTDETTTSEMSSLNSTNITSGTASNSTGTLATTTDYEANGSKYYYIVVWLNETGSAQEDVDSNQSYTGTVTFNAAGGNGVTATFSS